MSTENSVQSESVVEEVGIESPVNKLTRQISDSVDKEALSRHVAMIDKFKDDRTGLIGYEFSKALAKANVNWYKDTFHWFDNDYYSPINPSYVRLALTEAMRKNGVSYADITKRQSTIVKPAMDNAINRLLKPRPDLIAFKNCALDISKMQRIPITPNIPIITKLDYDYDPTAKCPMWDKFLLQVLPKEIDRICFQEFVGMIFINRKRVTIEKMCIMLGSGSNGKSVAGNTIEAMLGSPNVSTLDLSSLMTEGDAAAKAVAGIDGKMLNYSSELDKKELKGSGFKRLISGEAAMARILFKDAYKLENIPLFMACANELPYTADKSEGFYRRLLVIDFCVTITDDMKDHELGRKLKTELSGIFNWAIVGRDRFVAQGNKMTENENSMTTVNGYRIEQSSELSFLYGGGFMPFPCYDGHEERRITAADLMDAYNTYCRNSNRRPCSVKTMGLTLKEEGYEKINGRSNNLWVYYKAPSYDEWEYYHGLGLTSATKSEWGDMIEGKIKPKNGFSKMEQSPKAPPKQLTIPEAPVTPEVDEDYDPDDHPPID